MFQRLKLFVRRLLRSITPFAGMSRLGYTIVLFNLGSIAILMLGLLYFNQLREGLVGARIESLKTQAEIVAGAIAANASVNRGEVHIDPDLLLAPQGNGKLSQFDDPLSSFDFPINPEQVAPLLQRLLKPKEVRARVYGGDQSLMLDSQQIFSKNDVLEVEVPTKVAKKEYGWGERIENWFKWSVFYRDFPLYKDDKTGQGAAYSEVGVAMQGTVMPMVRMDAQTHHVISVAAPIKRQNKILGVLLLSTQSGGIEDTIRKDRRRILRLASFVAALAFLSSIFLAHYIGGPMSRLANAARRVRTSIKAREEIPDFTNRNDEIGDLSGALREMTSALYLHLDANEQFAADVAHELDTPLTSLKAGVEAMQLLKPGDPRRKEFQDMTIRDIDRLTRLIKDISDASRLDAELAKVESEPMDLQALAIDVVNIISDTNRDKGVNVRFDLIDGQEHKHAYMVDGHQQRLGQVINNLVKNAVSFSAQGQEVRVSLCRADSHLRLLVEDEGPGIPQEALERVFERFYTDRPDSQGFGNNSGLGLNISRQIVKAHNGRIWAENIYQCKENNKNDQKDAPKQDPDGARFIVELPAKYAKL